MTKSERYKAAQRRRAWDAGCRRVMDMARECPRGSGAPALPDLSAMVLRGDAAKAKVAEWRGAR